ncbi:MAG TPA: MBL fold metallo-hydrolase [Vicinamibacterales bacterium]|nr:MBL fold metallo-hydrolase [Vicinamibacterales bacterium]
MARPIALSVLVAAGFFSAIVAGKQQPAAPRVVEMEKLKENLFLLRGGGGNTAVFVTSTGIVVVDTKIPGWGQPLLDKIKEISSKPITTVINTHTHFDHLGGNPDFPATVEIIAHANTKTNAEQMKPVTGIPLEQQTALTIFKNSNGRGLPQRTFTDRLTLGRGADQVDLHYFGRGHTNGDAWVVFPALRYVHAGDIFSGKNLPLLDVNNGGSGIEIGDTLAKAAAALNAGDSIITGHSTVMTVDDLKQYAEFNKEFAATVQAAKKAGSSPEQIIAEWKMPATYTGYAAPQPARLKANVEAVYNALK